MQPAERQAEGTAESPCSDLTRLRMVVEVFAGSATLSWTARERGVKILAVDHGYNRHVPKVNCRKMNLEEKANQEKLFAEIDSDRSRSLSFHEFKGLMQRWGTAP